MKLNHVYEGDCLGILPTLPANSIDTAITDPPYGLTFMGKDWDHGVPGVRFWREIMRVCKPGAMLLAFGGTRTHHRLMVAIEDAGWEIRDVIMWIYGSGFPKSHNISKAIDKSAGAEREVVGMKPKNGGGRAAPSHEGWRRPWMEENGGRDKPFEITAPATEAAKTWDGWGTALKPAYEPIVVAMKPIPSTFAANALEWGVAGLNIDGARVGTDEVGTKRVQSHRKDRENWRITGGSNGNGATSTKGRWPANVIHDGSPEVVAGFPETHGAGNKKQSVCTISKDQVYSGGWKTQTKNPNYYKNNGGSAARFFYCAKASKRQRTVNGRVKNNHPTVKPVELIKYLCQLTKTPSGGVVLDPFAGSGTTALGCIETGRDYILIEQSTEYVEIARNVIEAWQDEYHSGPEQLSLID